METTRGKGDDRMSNSWGQTRSLIPACLIAVGVLLFAGFFVACGEKTDKSEVTKQAKSAGLDSPVDVEKKLKKVEGRWLRPDGGYVIEIRDARADGTLDASYLNPRPINVSRAKATLKEGAVEVFIELYDQGYPGSTYTLLYDYQTDAMTGIYFQAAVGQSFDVVFVRMK